MSGHTPGDGMDAKFHVHSAFGERVVKFAHFVLRLRNCHSVSRYDDHFVGGGKDRGGFFRGGTSNRLGFYFSRGGSLLLPEGAKQHVREGTIHRFGHVYGKNEAGSAIQC